jgi:hypothetical protein
MNMERRNLTETTNWNEDFYSIFDIKGIRQGAKLSTLLYKRYNNTILDSITKSTLGATIGNITVSAPACADDIALLGESKDIQAMLKCQYSYNLMLTSNCMCRPY